MDNIPVLTMLVGLPASGKSTYAEKLSKETSAVICSSDSFRKKLYGDESLQGDNPKIFNILHQRVKEFLREGVNVIYDATNINSKRRRAFLSELKNIPCIKKCAVVAAPYSECCAKNWLRERKVPHWAIRNMYKNWNTPYWFEGWNDIQLILRNDNKDINLWLNNHMSYNQHNTYHSMTLGKHCKSVSEMLKGDKLMECAGYLHDCGKPFTKYFLNSKGEKTDTAHYYQHQCVGAYGSLFYQYPNGIDKLDVSVLINLHMMPYFWERNKENGEKTRLKYQRLWGDDLYNKVMTLHNADKNAH